MKTIFSILIITLVFYQFSLGQEPSPSLLVGKTDVNTIEKNPQYQWFDNGYNQYNPDSNIVLQLKSIPNNYSFIAIGGTWCGDTHKNLPNFYKVIDQADIPRESISLFLVNTQKKSPEGITKKYNVKRIPTFIVLKNGKEVGRITENPEATIEKDLLNILKKTKA